MNRWKAPRLRLYRKTLAPNAPEQIVLSGSVSISDQDWSDELASKWGRYTLLLIGPKGPSGLEHSRLVLAAISESEPPSGRTFPTDKAELAAMRLGKRHDAVVPVPPENPPKEGERITFMEATSDPFGVLTYVPNGQKVNFKLTKVRDEKYKWVDQDLYYIAWDPSTAEWDPSQPERPARSVQKPGSKR